MENSLTILGIETSCDETAAAVYNGTHGVLSNVLFSQIELHKNYGGVVPELASRSHLEKITEIVALSLHKANVSIDSLDAIAVTNKPGLPGSLLVGVCFAKAMAWAINKKIIGVNHLEGHAFSAFLDNDIPFPHLCLTASGGHTSLYLMHDFGIYDILGQTKDDAAGEAFDKIAKLLELPYPGGPHIEKRAQSVEFKKFFDYPSDNRKDLDFSFSGLKTAVLYDLVNKNAYDLQNKKLLDHSETLKNHVASSLLVCIADTFEKKVKRALQQYPHIKALSFVGGVACNKYISQKLRTFCSRRNIQFFTPSPQYCTDNAAMIAFVGHYKALKGEYSDLDLDILV